MTLDEWFKEVEQTIQYAEFFTSVAAMNPAYNDETKIKLLLNSKRALLIIRKQKAVIDAARAVMPTIPIDQIRRAPPGLKLAKGFIDLAEAINALDEMDLERSEIEVKVSLVK